MIQLGFLKRQINIEALKRWRSKLFTIDTVNEIAHIPELGNSVEWQFLSDDMLKVIQHDNDSDITVIVTEYRLQDNFYMRKVDGMVVISLFEVADILHNHHIPIEHFIIKNIYEVVTLLHVYRDLPNTSDEVPDIIHDETRNCLFDMNGLKTDVKYVFQDRLSLCSQCQARLKEKLLPKGFLKELVHEIRRIRKSAFYKIYDFVKCHPIWSIVIAIISQLVIGLLTGLLANYIFFVLKGS